MIIKVCGMREPENVRQVAGLNIHWIGFIFYNKSPRSVDKGQLTVNNFNCPLSIVHCPLKRVGVFVNATVEQMLEAVINYKLDYLQLHGNETPELCYSLQKRGISLIKAFSIETKEDLKKVSDYEGRVDFFLFDTKCAGYGGSGKSFDWSVLANYTGDTPFILSGGINPDSVAAIKSFTHPQLAGIDLNSGFEIEPGLKDIDKLNTFIQKLNTEEGNSLITNR